MNVIVWDLIASTLRFKQAALEGEDKEIYSEKGVGKVQWKPAENDRAATWYKVS